MEKGIFSQAAPVGDVYQSRDDDYDDFSIDYEDRPITMSANLLQVLGLSDDIAQLETDWEPPSVYGLNNSARILPMRFTEKSSKLPPAKVFPMPSFGDRAEIAKMRQEAYNSDDDDDDDDSDAEEDERPIEMSNNLKRLLGLATDETMMHNDWSPPERCCIALLPCRCFHNVCMFI